MSTIDKKYRIVEIESEDGSVYYRSQVKWLCFWINIEGYPAMNTYKRAEQIIQECKKHTEVSRKVVKYL